MNAEKKEFVEIIGLALVYTLFSVIVWHIMSPYLTKEFISGFLENASYAAPLIMIFIQALQVLIAPIPVQPVGLASGYIFGALLGSVLSYLGLVLGSILAFYIGKLFGRPLVKKIVSKKIMDKYDGYIQHVSVFILTLIMWLPLFPDDEILYILGMSKTRFKKLIIPILIGKTGGATVSIIGAGLGKSSMFTVLIVVLAIMTTVFGFYYRNALEHAFDKFFRKHEARFQKWFDYVIERFMY